MITHWPDVLLSCRVDSESYGCGLEEGCFQGTQKINSPVAKGRVLEPGANEEVRTGAHWEILLGAERGTTLGHKEHPWYVPLLIPKHPSTLRGELPRAWQASLCRARVGRLEVLNTKRQWGVVGSRKTTFSRCSGWGLQVKPGSQGSSEDI